MTASKRSTACQEKPATINAVHNLGVALAMYTCKLPEIWSIVYPTHFLSHRVKDVAFIAKQTALIQILVTIIMDLKQSCYTAKISTGAIARSNSYFGSGTGPIHLSNIRCTGEESTIMNCSYSSPQASYCYYGDDAGVTCFRTVQYSELQMIVSHVVHNYVHY